MEKLNLAQQKHTFTNQQKCTTTQNKAVVDSILRPRCALPSAFPADNAIFNGEENPFPATGDAAYRKHAGERRATDIGNTLKIFGKDCACGSGVVLADRQTGRPTDRHAHCNALQLLLRAK